MTSEYSRKVETVQAVEFDGGNQAEVVAVGEPVVLENEEDHSLSYYGMPITPGMFISRTPTGSVSCWQPEEFPAYWELKTET